MAVGRIAEVYQLCNDCEKWDHNLTEAHEKLQKLEYDVTLRELEQKNAERLLDEESAKLDRLEQLVSEFERISGPVPEPNLTESMLGQIARILAGFRQEEDESCYEPETLQDMLRTLAFLQGRLLAVKRALI